LPLQKKNETDEPPQVKIRAKKERPKELSNAKDDSAKKITVSLSDCLACSGCITTAETVFFNKDFRVK
jgi:iron only hydrogenase large subunit-like protein